MSAAPRADALGRSAARDRRGENRRPSARPGQRSRTASAGGAARSPWRDDADCAHRGAGESRRGSARQARRGRRRCGWMRPAGRGRHRRTPVFARRRDRRGAAHPCVARRMADPMPLPRAVRGVLRVAHPPQPAGRYSGRAMPAVAMSEPSRPCPAPGSAAAPAREAVPAASVAASRGAPGPDPGSARSARCWAQSCRSPARPRRRVDRRSPPCLLSPQPPRWARRRKRMPPASDGNEV